MCVVVVGTLLTNCVNSENLFTKRRFSFVRRLARVANGRRECDVMRQSSNHFQNVEKRFNESVNNPS